MALESYRCYHCGLDSSGDSFKYFDNKKEDQPRFRCDHCHKFFTLGSHGRPQGKTYAKKRNEDPVELKSLSRQCRYCGVADNALFQYYNNNNLSQPRFKCLSCGKQFQMRLLGTGEEMRLVHTSSKQTRTPYRQKQAVPDARSGIADEIYHGSGLAVPSDALMPLEPNAHLLLEMSDEDVQLSESLEIELAEQEKIEFDPLTWTGSESSDSLSWTGNANNGNNPAASSDFTEYLRFVEAEFLTEENNEAVNVDAFSSTINVDGELPGSESSDPLSWTGNGNNGNNPAASSDFTEYLRFVEAEFLTEENNEAVNVDAFSSTINVDGELPLTWQSKDAEAMDFTGAGVALDVNMGVGNMGEMVSASESTSNGDEVMYETHEPTFGFDSWAWSPNDASLDFLGESCSAAIATY